MKTQKEKLIDILSVPIHPRIGVAYTEVVADYLIDNDVLPIVRCKDCRFLDNIALNHGICYCEKHHKEVGRDGYCSYGESKGCDTSVKNKAHERNNIKSFELCERCVYNCENCNLKCIPLKSCEMLDVDGDCKCVKVPLRTPCDYFVERDNY